jgi:hypothetical protein
MNDLVAQGTLMVSVDEQPDDRYEILELWRRYGERYNVFVPDEQPGPGPDGWKGPVPEPSDRGTYGPEVFKHWRHFEAVRDLLRETYRDHHILSGQSLSFDCLVPMFQKPLAFPDQEDSSGKTKHMDRPAWYQQVLSIVITPDGQTVFVCDSLECLRTKCKLNLLNPKRISPVDIYSLVQIFHGYRSVAKAKAIVAERMDLRIGKFDHKGIEKKSKVWRYAVPKHEVHGLIERYARQKRQHVAPLIQDAVTLIEDCSLVELEHSRIFSNYFAFFSAKIIQDGLLQRIGTGAVRLYLWLLVHQEEQARHNRFSVRLTNDAVAEALGSSTRTISDYRQELQKLGLLRIKGQAWTVRYTLDSQLHAKMGIMP